MAHSEHNGRTASSIKGSGYEAIREESTGKNNTIDSKGASIPGLMANANGEGLQGRNGKIMPECAGEQSTRESGSPNVAYSEHVGPIQSESTSRHREKLSKDRGIAGQEYYKSGGKKNWDSEPDVGRVANGIPDRVHRIKALGNSIVPQVAYQILQGIADIEGASL